MLEAVIEFALAIVAAYLTCGALFALPFCSVGVEHVDPFARGAKLGFRLLIAPGVTIFWPLLLKRWIGGITEPPTERTAHR